MEIKNLDTRDKKLIVVIAILSIILIVIFVFFMVERSKNKKHVAEINNEKVILEGELGKLSLNYDELRTENDSLNEKMLTEKNRVDSLLLQMRTFKTNSYSELNRYKKQIGNLKVVLRDYVVQIDSLNQINKKLIAENSQVKKQMTWVRERNTKLESESKKMKKVLTIASAITVEDFRIYCINKKGREIRWKRCYQLKAEFVIGANVTAKRGKRTIYLRILQDNDSILAFSKDSYFTYQNKKLLYSAKRLISYEGEKLEVAIFWPNDGSLKEGKYKVQLFSENELIGSGTFELN